MKQDECYKLIDDLLVKQNVRSECVVGKRLEDLQKLYAGIKSDIDLMMRDESPVLMKNPDFMRNLTSNLSSTISMFLYEAVDPTYCVFSEAFTHLIKNWNDNTLKDVNINQSCNTIFRFIDNRFTMAETCDTLKKLLKKMSEYRQWNPPAFQVSEHFIKALNKSTE